MSTPAVTVGPAAPVVHAAEVLAVRGFAALPVVDAEDRLLGVVAEADLVRDRVRPDPRLHARRDRGSAEHRPASTVAGIMTTPAACVDVVTDVADAARLLLDRSHRSVPVVEHGRVVGVLSRRDLLRTLLRPDEQVRADLLSVVEHYTGELATVDVSVVDGCAQLVRVHGSPDPDAAFETEALRMLALSVPGVAHVVVQDEDQEGVRVGALLEVRGRPRDPMPRPGEP